MSDKLKQFIEDNRGAFDSDEPGSRLLKNLRQEWDHGGQSKKVYQIKSIRWAAAIAGLIILSVALYFATQQQNAKDGIVRTSGENIDEKISASEPVYAKQIVEESREGTTRIVPPVC